MMRLLLLGLLDDILNAGTNDAFLLTRKAAFLTACSIVASAWAGVRSGGYCRRAHPRSREADGLGPGFLHGLGFEVDVGDEAAVDLNAHIGRVGGRPGPGFEIARQ